MSNPNHNQWLDKPSRRVPLGGVAIGLIAGIVIGRHGVLPVGVELAVAGSGLALAGFIFLYQHIKQNHQWQKGLLQFTLAMAVAVMGSVHYKVSFNRAGKNHLIHLARPEQSQLITFKATVTSKPTIRKPAGTFAKYDFAHGPRTGFTVACSSVQTNQGWQDFTGSSFVLVKEAVGQLELGDELKISGWLLPYQNKSQSPYQQLRPMRERLCSVVERIECIEVLAKHPKADSWLAMAKNKAQRLASFGLLEAVPWDEDIGQDDTGVRSFLSAMLLGQRNELSPAVYDQFVRTGTAHFLSVSGFHVGLIAAFAWWVGSFFRLPRWAYGTVVLGTIIFYLLAIPARPPAIRAGIICITFCIAYIARKRSDSLNLLCLAAIIILLLRPVELFSSGFQLSFGIVAGLIFFFKPFFYREYRYDRSMDLPPIIVRDENVPLHVILWDWVRQFFWGLIVVSMIAWVVSLPLTAYHFNRIAVWGVFCSVLAYPLISITIIFGFIKMILTILLPFMAGILEPIVTATGNASLSLIGTLSELPFSSIHTASPPLWFMIAFYGLISWGCFMIWRYDILSRIATRGILVCLIIFAWMLPFSEAGQRETGVTTLHVINVGHGSASVVTLPDGNTICFDAGSLSNFDFANRKLLPYLRAHGVNRINALFISHANIDHYNGVLELCREYDIEKVYVTAYFLDEMNSSTRFLCDELERLGIELISVARGDHLTTSQNKKEAGYRIDILWPPGEAIDDEISENSSSTVLEIGNAYGTILLCGDIEKEVQEQLIETHDGTLHCDVMVLPHHGSPVTLWPEFVERIDPDICISSRGKIKASTEDKLLHALPNDTILSTYERGDIVVQIDSAGITTKTQY